MTHGFADRTAAFTDRARLTTDAYATSGNLNARRSIYAYREPPFDIIEFAVACIDWRGDECILDVGCGPGQYVAGIRARHPMISATLADLSTGMVVEARNATGMPGIVADVTRLPFEDEPFDVTLAMHMLYHVPDIPAAAAEIRRVTKPAGVALVSTNGRDHLRELRRVFVEAASAVLGVETAGPPSHPADRFDMSNGAEALSPAFRNVRARTATGKVRLPEEAPFVAYVRSIRSLLGPLADEQWEAIVERCARRAAEAIAARGTIDLTVSQGVFICR